MLGRSTDSRPILTVALGTLFGVVLIRTAWIGDDAYITFRTVDNFVAGFGLRWNVIERVQSYTSPLWLFLFSVPYSFTREAFFTTHVMTIGLSLCAYALFLRRIAASTATAMIGGAILVLAKSYIDYSTSGLENPLTHLLLVFTMLAYWNVDQEGRGLTRLWLLAGLVALCRLDLSLLVGPALAARSIRAPWTRNVKAAAYGLLPLFAWELFSLIYYGVPFPNTAYAKLQTGIPSGELAGQGVMYVLDACSSDPVTALALIGGVTTLSISRRQGTWPLLMGAVLYLAYVVRIGGDFMAGRFLSAPLLLVLGAWAHEAWPIPDVALPAILGAIAALGLLATTHPPLTSGAQTIVLDAGEVTNASGVTDERVYYYRSSGLLRWSRARPLPWNTQVQQGQALRGTPAVVREIQIGFKGYYAGPAVTVIDELGLTDAFLARLPAAPGWRVGHYFRSAPAGYIESVQQHANLIVDPELAAQYERIRIVTQGRIWSTRRWRAIVTLNTGW